MRWIPGRKFIGFIGGALGMLLLVPVASAGRHKDHPYRYSVLDMPVSLAVGTVRTPAFPVASQWYWIMIQVEKPLPFDQMVCMMEGASGIDPKDCSKNDPLLQADWTVWDGDHIVDHGSSTTCSGDMFTNKFIFKTIGSFAGEAGKKYVLEVKFTKDGTPLNVANPHLIVIRQGEE